MTDEVAALVLRDNYRQNRALDNAQGAGARDGRRARRGSCATLEQQRHLDRAVERLPDDETLADRRNAGLGLTVPELAVLLAYAKITLEEELLASHASRRRRLPARARALLPHAAARAVPRSHPRAPAAPRDHRDRARERPGEPGRHDVRVPASARRPARPGADIVRAHEAARAIFGQEALWHDIEALDATVDVDVQTRAVPRVAQARRARQPLAAAPPAPARSRSATTVAFFAAAGRPADDLVARVRARRRARPARARRPPRSLARGVPAELAARIAALDLLPVGARHHRARRRARDRGRAGRRRLRVVGDRLRLDWLHDRIVELPRADRWDALARNALREDVGGASTAAIADACARHGPRPSSAEAAFDAWAGTQQAAVDRALAIIHDITSRAVFDLATLSVALREFRAARSDARAATRGGSEPRAGPRRRDRRWP